jgi:hypothetical protein
MLTRARHVGPAGGVACAVKLVPLLVACAPFLASPDGAQMLPVLEAAAALCTDAFKG